MKELRTKNKQEAIDWLSMAVGNNCLAICMYVQTQNGIFVGWFGDQDR